MIDKKFPTCSNITWILLSATLALIIISALLPATHQAIAQEKTTEERIILASIKPIQLILKALVGDEIEVGLLLPPSANPHYYQLKPSDVKKIHTADHLFWVGPGMEVFLGKVMQSSGVSNTALMTLIEHDEDESETKQSSEATTEGAPMTNSDEDGVDSKDHQHSGHEDPHIWLDPLLVARISEDLTEILANLYPSNMATFHKNQQLFRATLVALSERQQRLLNKAHHRPVFSAHDAFSRLAIRFGLDIRDFISVTPEARPGAAHLANLQLAIGALDSICFLQESQQSPSYIETIKSDTEIYKVIVDILATDTPVTESGYLDFITKLLAEITDCVATKQP